MVRKIDFAKFSSVKIGQIAEVAVLDETNSSEFEGVVIGGGNNILISPNPPKLGILDKSFDFIEFDGGILRIGGACKSAKIYNFARANNIAGFEFLRGIPGTLGGLLSMNAGLLGFAISDNLISVRTGAGEFDKYGLNFSYRKSQIEGVILEAGFKVGFGFDAVLGEQIAQKRANQPRGASFGSCFKNPLGDSAGRLIEACGLKGFKIGGAKFSELHANFLINFDNAKFDDAIGLIELAKKRVFEKFGVRLETEVVIL